MGLLISAPLIAASMLFVTWNSSLAYICVFLGEVALNCNWAIVADMLLVRFSLFTHTFMFFRFLYHHFLFPVQIMIIFNIFIMKQNKIIFGFFTILQVDCNLVAFKLLLEIFHS